MLYVFAIFCHMHPNISTLLVELISITFIHYAIKFFSYLGQLRAKDGEVMAINSYTSLDISIFQCGSGPTIDYFGRLFLMTCTINRWKQLIFYGKRLPFYGFNIKKIPFTYGVGQKFSQQDKGSTMEECLAVENESCRLMEPETPCDFLL